MKGGWLAGKQASATQFYEDLSETPISHDGLTDYIHLLNPSLPPSLRSLPPKETLPLPPPPGHLKTASSHCKPHTPARPLKPPSPSNPAKTYKSNSRPYVYTYVNKNLKSASSVHFPRHPPSKGRKRGGEGGGLISELEC